MGRHLSSFKSVVIIYYMHPEIEEQLFLLFDLREDGMYTYIRGGRANAYNLLGNCC